MFLQVFERSDAEKYIFWRFRRRKNSFYEKICILLFVTFTYDRIEFNFFANDVEYIYFIEYLHFDAQQHLCCGFFLKTWNFHCTRRSKNWEFQILQIINFLKTTKMIPECQDLLRLLVCASWSCIGVSWTCRDIAITTFWIYIPPPPLPLPP